MIIINNFIKIFIISIIIYGCKDNPSSTNTISDLYPLKVGNSWTYNTVWYDSTGKVLNQYNYTTTILGDTTIDSVKWFYMSSSKSSLYSNRTNGTYLIKPPMISKPSLLYKIPDKSYEEYYLLGDVGSLYDTLSKVEMTVQEKGIVQYKTMWGGDIQNDYLQSGVGLIKSELYGKTFNRQYFLGMKTEMISYNIK